MMDKERLDLTIPDKMADEISDFLEDALLVNGHTEKVGGFLITAMVGDEDGHVALLTGGASLNETAARALGMIEQMNHTFMQVVVITLGGEHDASDGPGAGPDASLN